ncbi:hypothetical protein AHOG_21610 [Actinoalloteichus hoggarensis]|uniref:Uncharacterized protein n=1 Tax=Actinoalloteichus hoggarensis TaxID=1470176 RepID=A0A221W7P8_9PSEU|nr:hypothetical protein AHOG_21610 [Actinoalloteichus hoggarensis]
MPPGCVRLGCARSGGARRAAQDRSRKAACVRPAGEGRPRDVGRGVVRSRWRGRRAAASHPPAVRSAGRAPMPRRRSRGRHRACPGRAAAAHPGPASPRPRPPSSAVPPGLVWRCGECGGEPSAGRCETVCSTSDTSAGSGNRSDSGSRAGWSITSAAVAPPNVESQRGRAPRRHGRAARRRPAPRGRHRTRRGPQPRARRSLGAAERRLPESGYRGRSSTTPIGGRPAALASTSHSASPWAASSESDAVQDARSSRS